MSETALAPVLELTRRGLCAELSVRGELDLASVEALEQLLEPVPTCCGALLLVDLGRCTFIDSSIIALLLRWRARAAAAGGDLVVLVRPGAVLATLEVAGATDLLSVVQETPDGVGAAPALVLVITAAMCAPER